MNPMDLSEPWDDSIEIISLQPVRKIARGEPNGPYWPLGRLSLEYFLEVRKITKYEPNGP